MISLTNQIKFDKIRVRKNKQVVERVICMYTVMLIDDDYLSLLKLEKMFPWEKYSFKNVLSTTDPNTALQMLPTLNPDVVFTDVQMCNVNGFDIIDFAKSNNLKSVFVIISGYDYFEYAQQAIRMNVIDYMLKPVTPEDCERIFSVLKNILDKESNAPHSVSLPTGKYKITNKAFADLIEYINNNITKSLSLMKLSQKFSINLSYCCQLFQKYYSCNFSEYVLALKLKKSTELLTQTDMTISEIAEHLSYDYSHFCKVFKKRFGITPYIYRKMSDKREAPDNEDEN